MTFTIKIINFVIFFCIRYTLSSYQVSNYQSIGHGGELAKS